MRQVLTPNGATEMTNQATRTKIVLICNTFGWGVSFRGGSDAHLATVTAPEGDHRVKIVSGRLDRVLNYLECVAA